jgi:excisionase family DNA binding protein
MSDLSVREAAIELHSTTKWVYDLLYAGRLPGAVKAGRVWRIPRGAVRQRKPTVSRRGRERPRRAFQLSASRRNRARSRR